ncbi:GGDEF domain-containing protein [Rhodococcus sp. ARC_M12]|uniref:GGDEF domain-containing protein n=1 Tax=Rhodococcus sp. ARC_M12 TaxID=2928854 RepID=UPI001FB207A9|nr:GGDEF domain-containing protein [Rhodococcus sp. ARC_M12]MCJ0980850.1 GGDEF domain-containing protein [Rhodococcus sp. ARC_M12]
MSSRGDVTLVPEGHIHMHLLRRWWSFPADFAWSAAYHRMSPLLSHVHVAVGIWCWFFAVLCVAAAHTPAGFDSGSAEKAGYAIAAANTLVGLAWVRGPIPTETMSRLFVVYIEVTIAALLFLLADPFVALPGAAALGIIGSYIAVFHNPKMFVAHQTWSVAVTGALLFRAVMEPSADVVLAYAYLILLTLILFSAPILTQSLLLLLRSDAATAFYDPLTGLRNRRGLDAAITQRGNDPDEHGSTAAVLVVDLDGFKLVNDRFGHAHGDVVLRVTAEAIDAAFPPPAITARTGGEEFAILTYVDTVAAIEQFTDLQTRLAADSEVGVTVSVGGAHLEGTSVARDFRGAWSRADVAMYAAKRAGGNSVSFDV